MNAPAEKSTPLLEAQNLSKHFSIRHGAFSGLGPVLAAVDRVSFTIVPGQVFGLVGESGSGKSTLGRIIMRLVRPDSGRVLFKGRDLAGLRPAEDREARQKIQIVFQDPSAALSPRRTIFQTLSEPLQRFALGEPGERADRAVRALETVGLDAGALPRLPHQFSSGQRQRIGIARALLTEPELIVADEAVSALDVSVQAQILELILHLREARGIAFLFISHDLAVIQAVSDVAGVMFAGQLVEVGPSDALFGNPRHPYTRELLAAVPDPDPAAPRQPAPDASGLARRPRTTACVFTHRCPEATGRCNEIEPVETTSGRAEAHRVKCHLYT